MQSEALRRLGDVSKSYEKAAIGYRDVAIAAAEAEGLHKAERAKEILKIKANASERISQSEAETRAEADDYIADLYMTRLTTAAIADAERQRLHQLRSQIEVGRSTAAYERQVDELHASGLNAGGNS